MQASTSLLRPRGGHESAKVTMVELLFDLVFVFAITQLSHTLLAALTWLNALQVSLLLLAVWSTWMGTSWVANWLHPDRLPMRLFLFATMLVGLVMSASLPKAFALLGWAFGSALAAMQLGRAAFFAWAMRHERASLVRNAWRSFVWQALGALAWLIGGWLDPPARLACWSVAIALAFIAPWVGYWVPGLGRSQTSDWEINGAHVAERCGLFVIIALGESLLITGAAFSGNAWTATSMAAFAAAALGSLALWWIYFDQGAEHAAQVIGRAQNPGETARSAYSFIHILIVAGIIVCAVGDELVLVHPDHATPAAILLILLGPALFLIGTALFKWVVYERRWPPFSHTLGLLLLLALIVPAVQHWLSALGLGIATTAVLIFVLVWEAVALRSPGKASHATT